MSRQNRKSGTRRDRRMSSTVGLDRRFRRSAGSAVHVRSMPKMPVDGSHIRHSSHFCRRSILLQYVHGHFAKNPCKSRETGVQR